MAKLRTGCATPFEVIQRFHTRTDTDFSLDPSVKPVFFFAESPLLVGRASRAQKANIYQMLGELNASQGHLVDVPLRSLRCKNFVDAGSGHIVKKKQRQRSLLNDFESSFG